VRLRSFIYILCPLFSWLSVSAQQFTDRAAVLGIDVLHSAVGIDDDEWGTGAAWIDYDQDGDLDLYVSNRSSNNQFFENLTSQGSIAFQDITYTLGLECSLGGPISCDGAGISVADFDNNGYPDIYLATAQMDVFYKNEGGVFTDVTAAVLGAGTSHISGYNRGTSVSWIDFDNDGYLDLYLSHHKIAEYYEAGAPGPADARDYLLHNHQGEYFEDASFLIDMFGVRGASSFIGGWTDYDDDGDFDLIVTNDCLEGVWPTGTIVYQNLGPSGSDWTTWQFDTVQVDLGVGTCDNAMGIAIGDINRDGNMDVAWSNIGRLRLWRNDDGTYTDIGTSAGVDHQDDGHYSWGLNLADMDNDGWKDLLLTSGYLNDDPTPGEQDLAHPNYYFRNLGASVSGEQFSDYSELHNYSDTTRGRTSVTADYDNDGDLDVYVVNYDSRAQFKQNNLSSSQHYVKISLEGVISNRDGIGSKVTVVSASGTQYAEHRSGESLGGGNSPYLHFGLGSDDEVSTITVTWPSGIIQSLGTIPSDTLITILEDIGLPSSRMTLHGDLDGSHVSLVWTSELYEVERAYLVETTETGRIIDSITHIDDPSGTFDVGHKSQGIYYYQIRGATTFSNIVKLRIDATGTFDFSVSASMDGKLAVVMPQPEAGRIVLADIQGRVILDEPLTQHELNRIDQPVFPGYYIVTIMIPQGSYSRKVFVH